jgi:hypothetical protein
MTAEDLLSRLDGVRRCGQGWLARCPAHDDRDPSLSIREGDKGVLLKCWAGCSYSEIMAAIGETPDKGFYDAGLDPRERPRAVARPRLRPFDWRRFAGELQDEALDHWLRGTAVLEAARGLDSSTWTAGETDDALEAVTCAHADLARAECLDRLAVNIRAGGLRKEQERGAQLRHSAA